MLFYVIYYGTMILLIPGLLLSLICRFAINMTYKRYSKINCQSGWVANEMSEMLLQNAGVIGIGVQRVEGQLTDSFDPCTLTVNLSSDVYDSSSISALSVSAHEVGHAVQFDRDYKPMKFRSLMVKVVNIGSRFSVPLAILGLIICSVAQYSRGSVFQTVGEFILFLSIIAYSLTAVFALITLPVELNASRRAKKMLLETNVMTHKELSGASKVLRAAAWTYVATLAVSILYLLRFIIIIALLKRKD